jgi:hypothetical protein
MHSLTTVTASVAGDSLGFILTEKNNFPIIMVALGTDGQGETYPHHVQVISPEVHPDDIHYDAQAIANKVNEVFAGEMEQEQMVKEIGNYLVGHITIDF